MQRLRKVGVVMALAVIVAIGSPLAAAAGTTYSGFSVTIGKFGGNGYTANQTKAASGGSGNVNISFVGNNYQVGASMLRSDNVQEGTKRYNLGAGYSATLPNSISAGKAVKMKLWGNPVWPVAVQANGTWRSN